MSSNYSFQLLQIFLFFLQLVRNLFPSFIRLMHSRLDLLVFTVRIFLHLLKFFLLLRYFLIVPANKANSRAKLVAIDRKCLTTFHEHTQCLL